MSKIDFFFVVEKKLLKADKRNDSKEARRTFRRKHYRHFQKKKDMAIQNSQKRRKQFRKQNSKT